MIPKRWFVVVASVIALFCVSGAAQAAEEFVLKFGDTHPLTHFYSVNGHQYFMKRVEELTGGRVKFKHYPAEQLGKERDLIELARQGVGDIVYTGAGQSSGKMPLGGAIELPGLGDDCVRNTRVYQILITSNPLFFQEFQRLGLRPLMGALFPPYQILTSKKPVQKLADLRGLKIRVNSPVMASAIEALGGTPVTLTSSEVFEGMQRGTVDGYTFTYLSVKSWKLEEVTNYGTVGADPGTVAGIWMMNANTWKKLPADIQKIITQVADETSVHLSKASFQEEKDAIAYMEKQGKILYHLTPADQQEWKKKAEPAVEKWISTMEARGLPGRRAIEEIQKTLKEVSAQ